MSQQKFKVPAEGISISLTEGNTVQRIHLDLSAQEGISLSMVGAATASLRKGNTQTIKLIPSKDGITLSMVGAATASRRG